MVMPWPVLCTIVPRRRPSVGFRQIARTRLSPICCATSAVMVMVLPSSSASISRARLISGRASGGNSTSTTGPAIATTRPSFRVVSGVSAVIVMMGSCGAGRSGVGRVRGEQIRVAAFDGVGEVVGVVLSLAEGLGAGHDLHDLGGDCVLAGAVHHPAQAGDQVGGVVGGGLHRP